MQTDRDFSRPGLAFHRLHKTAVKPELFTGTDNSFTLCTLTRIYSLAPWHEIDTGVGVTMPPNFTLAVQQHPFAMNKGLLVAAAWPITHLHEGSIRLRVLNLWPEGPRLADSQKLLIDAGRPIAIVTLLAAPMCDEASEGWDEKAVEGWK